MVEYVPRSPRTSHTVRQKPTKRKPSEQLVSPSWHYPPNGPITLGNIVRAADKIVPPLCAPPHQLRPAGQHLHQDRRRLDSSRICRKGVRFGVWAKFLQFLDLGIDVGIDMMNEDISVYELDCIDTEEFFPDEEMIKRGVANPAVKSFLEESRSKKEIYMIVGVKRVTGARVKSIAMGQKGGGLDIALDSTVLGGAPLSINLKKSGFGVSTHDI
ncbi:hypothetical protein ACMFMF_003279 [Clarireedia jacksonii]